jgi:GNAT superfamily N-acetyltransferase
LRAIEPAIGEIKRLYVRPYARRKGIGAGIIEHLLEQAQSLGMFIVRLDSFKEFSAAQTLFRSNGFVEREPYVESEIPEPLRQYWRFFEREL